MCRIQRSGSTKKLFRRFCVGEYRVFIVANDEGGKVVSIARTKPSKEKGMIAVYAQILR